MEKPSLYLQNNSGGLKKPAHKDTHTPTKHVGVSDRFTDLFWISAAVRYFCASAYAVPRKLTLRQRYDSIKKHPNENVTLWITCSRYPEVPSASDLARWARSFQLASDISCA